jgi:hypothetical protein
MAVSRHAGYDVVTFCRVRGMLCGVEVETVLAV